MTPRALRPTLSAAGLALAATAIGVLATDPGGWYGHLRMPAWRPPEAVFAPAWTLMLGLAVLSAADWWRAVASPSDRRRLIGLFAVNVLLGLSWSLLFFKAHRPDWALLEAAMLWLSIAALIAATPDRRSTPAWLLVPYLAWATFTVMLNFAVVRLNGPFG